MNTTFVKCVDFTFDGQGLAKTSSNRVVFVPSLLIGEEAEVEILYRKKDFDVGKIVKLVKKSPYRINPACKCATSCGGCCFQNLDYKKQLEYKKDVAQQTIKSIGKIETKISNIYGMEEPYFYRNKIQVPFGYDKQHRLVYGFYKFKSHDIIYNQECVIEDQIHVSILKNIKVLLEKFDIKPYDEDKRRGILRHVLIRVGKATREVMVVLIVNERSFKNKSQFVKELVKLCPEITTIVLNENSRKTNVILGDREETLYGPGFIYDILCGLKFKISSKSFYQTNPTQTEVLYNLAISKAELKETDVVLDAYCGIGTIGLIVAKHVKEVVGVEIVKEAIIDAKNNAKINNITNSTHICADCSDYMLEKKFDVVFVDPPRKGLDTKFINALLKSKPKKIVYVSCDVGTLARDLNILSPKYYIRTIDLVDMFPHTRHAEAVTYLEAKPDPKKVKTSYGSDYSMFKEKNRGSRTSRNICDSHWDGA